jgi:uncharacterized protein (DUF433 family)
VGERGEIGHPDKDEPRAGGDKLKKETLIMVKQVDWTECPLVEVIPGKVSGAPLLKNTRLPVEAITSNYDAFRAAGLSSDAAIDETLDCYPQAGIENIRAILSYRATHTHQDYE